MDNLAYIDDSSLKEKTEMIDGRIYMMSPRPRVTHALACTNIVREFGLHLRGKICTAFCDGVDVFLDEKNRFVPDVMIVCNPDIIKASQRKRIAKGSGTSIQEVNQLLKQFEMSKTMMSRMAKNKGKLPF